MSEYDVHTRRQLASERAERLTRDYGAVSSGKESHVRDGGARRRVSLASLFARLRRGSVDHAPVFRS